MSSIDSVIAIEFLHLIRKFKLSRFYFLDSSVGVFDDSEHNFILPSPTMEGKHLSGSLSIFGFSHRKASSKIIAFLTRTPRRSTPIDQARQDQAPTTPLERRSCRYPGRCHR